MSVQCPRCRQKNPGTTEFCARCHAPLRYVCPACKHAQARGGKCDGCGVDFAKYAMMQLAQVKTQLDRERERVRSRYVLIKHLVLAPVTGGLSLLKYFRSRRPRA